MMAKRIGKRYCMAVGCNNNSKSVPGLSLFSLPRDPERRRTWLIKIGREDLLDIPNLKHKSHEVCSVHFEDTDIKTINQLHPEAIPTKHCHDSQGESSTDIEMINNKNKIENAGSKAIITRDKQTQTSKYLIESIPMYEKLSTELKDTDCKLKTLETDLDKLKIKLDKAENPPSNEEAVTQKLQTLISWNTKIQKQFKGNRYRSEYKMFALNLHYSCPQMYRCLQTILTLPSTSTLDRFKIKVSVNLDNRVLETLLMKIKSLPENAKYCTICIDEMALKRNLYYDLKTDEVIGFHNINGNSSSEIANNVYVIMLQGIFYNWNQPVAYAFVGSTKQYAELDKWLTEMIEKLFDLGVNIKAIISDHESNFDKYAKEIKRISIDRPYFWVGDRKIYYIFDVPHLLMSLRDNLLLNNFIYNRKVISWKYVKELYEDQKKRCSRLISKINTAHVQPNTVQKSKIRYAAQMFSNTVSAALETYIEFGKISEDGRATATFIKTINDLFDVLNSHDGIGFRMTGFQTSILEGAQNMFANILIDNNNTKANIKQIKIFEHFQISIQSMIQLFEDLKKEKFYYVFSGKLNQDNLQNFLVSLRVDSNSINPTPCQFTKSYSRLFLKNLLKVPSDQYAENSEFDIYEVMVRAEDVFKTKITSLETECQSSLIYINGESDSRLELPMFNVSTYIASYLIFKCSEKHDCVEMQYELNSAPDLSSTTLYTFYKECNKNAKFYGKLKVPKKEFVQYVEKLEDMFVHNFSQFIQNRPGSKIFELLKEVPQVKLCPCFLSDYVLKLFVKLRTHAALEFNNNYFTPRNKSTRQYFKIKLLE